MASIIGEEKRMDIEVIVDYQNLFKMCEGKGIELTRAIEEIMRRGLERGRIHEVRLFIPNFQLITSPWRLLNRLQLEFSVALEVCSVLTEGGEMDEKRWKDTVDSSVLTFVMRHIHPKSGADLVVFVSGDGHFLCSSNLAKLQGKEIEFWVVNPEATSETIFKNVIVRELTISDQTILAGSEENPFLTALQKATEGESLSPADKKRIALLKRVAGILPSLGKPVTLDSKIMGLAKEISESLGVPEVEGEGILKALIVLGIVRIPPVPTYGFGANTSSSLFQWLNSTGE